MLREPYRARLRSEALAAELQGWAQEAADDVADGVVERAQVLRAPSELPDDDIELLTLVAWHGLTRAAAFRVLADLPGTRLVPTATDALGRRGTAVTLTDAPTSQGAVLQSWLIIDPRTSTALAQESHVVKAGGQQAGLAPGTRWYSVAVKSSGWTDQAPPR